MTPRKPKTIGIVGSRRRNSGMDQVYLQVQFDKVFRRGDRIVSGGCPKGGDFFAEVIARVRQIPITIHYAWWDGPDGNKAGFVRNSDIARDCDVLLALVAADRKGGTEDTIVKARRLGKKVILILPDGDTETINAPS